MFTENDLRELLDFTSSDPVLSVYLNTNPTEGNSDTFKLHLRNMLKKINLPQDVEAVERYFKHEHNWSGRCVAVFSCAPQKFFRAHSLAVPLRSLTLIAGRPAVKPLANLLDNFGGYGVVLTDKQGARLFSFHMGELHEQEGVLGQLVKHIKGGGASSLPGLRGGATGRTGYMDEVVERNMRDIAKFAAKFFEENHVRRILIGGTDDNTAMLRSVLPKAWQSLIVGSFPMSMTASHTEVLASAMETGAKEMRQREMRLVDETVTAAAKAGNAVVGLTDTLNAINEGRVQTLIFLTNFHSNGYHCIECNRLEVNKTDQLCQNCNGRTEAVEDVVDLAVSSVMRQGGEVEVLNDNSILQKAGSIAAILRY